MEMSFEEKLLELENIVQKLENGKLSLDESLLTFEKGISLVKECNNILECARLRVEKLIEENNELGSEPFDLQDEGVQGK
ncbi:Exodeoxyribonuclease 7 small subunit [uncultured archaeon]|nr:Exodeoxyribonuclease 7 small subunit [uncultured archaeon]